MSEIPLKPKRRPRYRGTHPRRFHEKYKELAPDKFPAAVQKVLASGKTPAGTHRPVCLREVLEILGPQPGQTAVDATLGYGGHAREILPRLLPGGRLVGLDTDPIELEKTAARLQALGAPADALSLNHTNFAGLARLLGSLGIDGADMVLADLGCSSMQLDNPDRGFSYKLGGPLDLRLNPGKGRPASALLATVGEGELEDILVENADEPAAGQLAEGLLACQREHPLETTVDLVNAIRKTLAGGPARPREDLLKATLQRVFQALRIAVNDEFGALEMFLRFLPDCLKSGGRAVILTFHSGEDRRVKKAFLEGERDGFYAKISRELIRPSGEEIRANPRASSAKLRWALRR